MLGRLLEANCLVQTLTLLLQVQARQAAGDQLWLLEANCLVQTLTLLLQVRAGHAAGGQLVSHSRDSGTLTSVPAYTSSLKPHTLVA